MALPAGEVKSAKNKQTAQVTASESDAARDVAPRKNTSKLLGIGKVEQTRSRCQELF